MNVMEVKKKKNVVKMNERDTNGYKNFVMG